MEAKRKVLLWKPSFEKHGITLKCTHHCVTKTTNLTDSKLWTDKDHSFYSRILKLKILKLYDDAYEMKTYAHVGRETLCSVTRKFADDLEVVKLCLETRQELLSRRHQVGIELQKMTNQLPQLLE